MEIRPLAASAQGPQGLEALGATAAAAPTQQQQQPEPSTGATTLEPAVKLDLTTSNTGKARYIQDPDTSAIVFQVLDTASGNVIDQLPSETALRNRAYDSAREARAPQTSGVSRVA